MRKRSSQFKFHSRYYNIKSNYDVKNRGMKLSCNNKLFPSLNEINSKVYPYRRKFVIRNYNYRDDPKYVK